MTRTGAIILAAIAAIGVSATAASAQNTYPGGLPGNPIGIVAPDMRNTNTANAAPGGGPHVRVFSGAEPQAAEGTPDIITSAGPGAGPHVRNGGAGNDVLTDIGGRSNAGDDVFVEGRIITSGNFHAPLGTRGARRGYRGGVNVASGDID